MIEYDENNGNSVVTITDPSGVADGAELKEVFVAALEKKGNIKLLVKTEQPIHVSCCLLIYSMFINKGTDIEKTIEDENNLLSKSFSDLGLNIEYDKINNIN
ncbi:MAG: hypothetical protein JEY94_06185 [Melioribacteraceae bacterium]|nr:hypothetical protein [Melioribacteraceae bacterium]